MRALRVIALLAAYNEERFIGPCLENHIKQGLDVYLIDNGSTDQTVAVAECYLDHGLIALETFPRQGMYSWEPLLARKEELAATLDADWFVHVDADEIRLPPGPDTTLAEALAEVDRQGYNAVNFMEFTFVPTKEAPDHDHPGFQQTMRWYYPFLPSFPHRLNAWKRQVDRVDLASEGGHRVSFPGLRMWPNSFPMRHYLFLSVPHALEKYTCRNYDPLEVERGWHGARANLNPAQIRLPSQRMMRYYESDDTLDPSNPRVCHYLFDVNGWAGNEPV
jgi:glycosyltransferase involved in cell wall biosynthesis